MKNKYKLKKMQYKKSKTYSKQISFDTCTMSDKNNFNVIVTKYTTLFHHHNMVAWYLCIYNNKNS